MDAVRKAVDAKKPLTFIQAQEKVPFLSLLVLFPSLYSLELWS